MRHGGTGALRCSVRQRVALTLVCIPDALSWGQNSGSPLFQLWTTVAIGQCVGKALVSSPCPWLPRPLTECTWRSCPSLRVTCRFLTSGCLNTSHIILRTPPNWTLVRTRHAQVYTHGAEWWLHRELRGQHRTECCPLFWVPMEHNAQT